MKKNKMPYQIRVSNSLVGILLKKSAPVHIVPTCAELRKESDHFESFPAFL
jgi:hypothetical protein